MKEFLQKLLTGVPSSSLDKRELKFVRDLIKAKVLADRPFLRLDHDLIVGVYLQPKIMKSGKASAGYLQPLGVKGRDYLVQSADSLNAAHRDLAIARTIGNRRGRAAAKIIYIAQESGEKPIGYVSYKNNRAEILDINTAMPLTANVKQKKLKELKEGAVVSIDPKNGEIADILGVLSDPKVDETIVLSRYNRADRFSAEQILEAKAHGDKVDRSLYPDRIDLCALPFITIDPIDAKDFDDSIYYDYEKRVLYVAIADVTAYVSEFGEIDKEARKRGFSVYLPHKSIPMLPRELSENLCSLQPNVDRLAFTFKLELDENLNVKKYDLFESVIKSVRRYHYDRIDELFEGAERDSEDCAILKWLLPLKELIIALREKRLKKGYGFSNPEIKLILDKNLALTATKKSKETLSHKLIEECMLLANCAAAEYFQFGVFRTHEPPDDRSLDELVTNLSELGVIVKRSKSVHSTFEAIQKEAMALGFSEQVDRMLIRSLKRAQYTYDNIGHFGLGFSKYTHFTSPIRRYPDLALHRLLKAIINKNEKQKGYILSSLQRFAPIVTLLETEVAQIEWQYADRAFARWAAKRIGLVLEGEVLEEALKGKEAVVIIDDPQIQGMRVYLPLDRKRSDLHKFGRVKVSIQSAHLATARITVALA
ncbi:MAG: RNB domain-containing ribonuclease [Helicobacteraceae bacterium]|jgi:ribonuclease R|nr:RNB domain-containing ribonuclease [Helicobacteraceae bacterium]